MDGHLSLRGVATVLLSLISVLGSLLPLSLPYHQTVRTWLLRCGLFLLRRVVPPRDDWVWIIDCTIRIGQRKCLLVLGASLEQLQGSPDGLGHHQVVVLDLWVTAECTGIDVDDRLQALARRVGAPRQIVFDHGSDLNKGVHLFQESHPEVIDTYDVTHKLACLVKAELESDPRWAEFVQRSTRSMSQLQQTCGAFLMPPSLRSMARYMNVDRRINWASRMLNLLEAPEQAKAAELLGMPEEQALSWLSEKLGWLKDFREEVAHYQHLVDAVRQTEVEVKDHGLGQQTAQKVWSRLAPEVLQDAGLDNFLTELRNYLQEEGSKVPLTESWLGTSDVIESLFGKYKWFGEKAPYAEVGASVLALPVLTAELTAELIDQAMRRVSVQDVRDWVAENIGPSTLSKVCAVAAAGKKSRQSASADTDSG